MLEQQKAFVKEYIQKIWNEQQLHLLDQFVHEDYRDHSFVPGIPPTREGLRFWINNTSKAFSHETIVESIVAEADSVALRITFKAKHIGNWRNLAPTLLEIAVKGFRQFRIREERIIEHWALIDGESLQSALSQVPNGCTVSLSRNEYNSQAIIE